MANTCTWCPIVPGARSIPVLMGTVCAGRGKLPANFEEQSRGSKFKKIKGKGKRRIGSASCRPRFGFPTAVARAAFAKWIPSQGKSHRARVLPASLYDSACRRCGSLLSGGRGGPAMATGCSGVREQSGRNSRSVSEQIEVRFLGCRCR